MSLTYRLLRTVENHDTSTSPTLQRCPICYSQTVTEGHPIRRRLRKGPIIDKITVFKQNHNSNPLLVKRRRQWHPTPVLLPGESHGRRSLVGYSPHGLKESDMTERLHFLFHFNFDPSYTDLKFTVHNGNCICITLILPSS